MAKDSSNHVPGYQIDASVVFVLMCLFSFYMMFYGFDSLNSNLVRSFIHFLSMLKGTKHHFTKLSASSPQGVDRFRFVSGFRQWLCAEGWCHVEGLLSLNKILHGS